MPNRATTSRSGRRDAAGALYEIMRAEYARRTETPPSKHEDAALFAIARLAVAGLHQGERVVVVRRLEAIARTLADIHRDFARGWLKLELPKPRSRPAASAGV
jgi:hypothetical protein